MQFSSCLRTLALVSAAAAALPALAQQTLTVVNFGGANGAAQKKAYFEAYEKAFKTDSTSAFGGIIAFNTVCDAAAAAVAGRSTYLLSSIKRLICLC